MASLLDQYRKQQAWANLSRIGQGLLMASAGNMPLGQGLAYGLGQAQTADPTQMRMLRQEEEKQRQNEAWRRIVMGGEAPPPPDAFDELTASRLEKEGQTASLAGPAGGAPSLMSESVWNRRQGPFAGMSPEMRRQVADLDPTRGAWLASQMTKAPQPPPTRTIKRGDEFVTEEYKGGKWNEISRAPRYKPEGTSVDFGGLAEAMTGSQKGKEAAALRESRVQATKMVDMGSSLVSNLRKAGADQTVSWSGTMTRGIDTAVSQGRAIARNFGMKLDVTDPRWDFAELASESDVNRSKILGLAVAITKADQGSRPSDFDVQTSIRRIAGSAGSASRMADTIESLVAEKMRGFEIRYNDLAPAYNLEPFSWEEQLKRHRIDAPGLADPLGIR